MLLTFLSRLMATLLTTLLFITVVGATANQTILNTHYVETKLESQNAYSRLSTALSEEISKNANKEAETPLSQAELEAQLKKILAAPVLQAKVETTLKQLKAYYQSDGPVPTIDISDLVKQAQESGLEIDSDKFGKPVELTAVTKTKKVSDTAKIVGIGTLVAVIALLAGVLAIAAKRRDFRPLANIIFTLGLMLAITGGSMLFIPRIFNRLYKFDPATNPFGSLAHDLAIVAIRDFGLRLLIAGGIALLLGTVAKLLLRRHMHKGSKGDGQLAYAKAEPTKASEPVADPVSISDAPTTPPQPKVPETPGAPPAPRQPSKPRKIQL